MIQNVSYPWFEQSRQSGTASKTLADDAHGTKDGFSYLYHENIIPGIKAGRNSSADTGCHPKRRSVLAQLHGLDLWKGAASHGDRRIAESVSSAFRRMSGGHVASHKRKNMVHELRIKVCMIK